MYGKGDYKDEMDPKPDGPGELIIGVLLMVIGAAMQNVIILLVGIFFALDWTFFSK